MTKKLDQNLQIIMKTRSLFATWPCRVLSKQKRSSNYFTNYAAKVGWFSETRTVSYYIRKLYRGKKSVVLSMKKTRKKSKRPFFKTLLSLDILSFKKVKLGFGC